MSVVVRIDPKRGPRCMAQVFETSEACPSPARYVIACADYQPLVCGTHARGWTENVRYPFRTKSGAKLKEAPDARD